MTVNNETLNKAIVLYIGYNIAKYPQEDEMRLVKEFGVEDAVVLKREISSKPQLEERKCWSKDFDCATRSR